MLLFRRIDETRWFDKEFLESASVTELSTTDNELSVWINDGSVSELDIGLAYILTQRSFKSIWCVKIPDNALSAKKLLLRQQDSSTPFVAMRSYHTNILVPTVLELADLAEIIYELVKDHNANCKFFTETELKVHFYDTIVKDAIHIDFTSKINQAKWNTIKEMEKNLGPIDFSRLINVKPR